MDSRWILELRCARRIRILGPAACGQLAFFDGTVRYGTGIATGIKAVWTLASR